MGSQRPCNHYPFLITGIFHLKPIIRGWHRPSIKGAVPANGRGIQLFYQFPVPVKNMNNGINKGLNTQYIPVIVEPIGIGRKEFGITNY